jgi:hypothetical protein
MKLQPDFLASGLIATANEALELGMVNCAHNYMQ